MYGSLGTAGAGTCFRPTSKTTVYTADRMYASQEPSCIQVDDESCNLTPVTRQKTASWKAKDEVLDELSAIGN
jgi:hypothetical protein